MRQSTIFRPQIRKLYYFTVISLIHQQHVHEWIPNMVLWIFEWIQDMCLLILLSLYIMFNKYIMYHIQHHAETNMVGLLQSK